MTEGSGDSSADPEDDRELSAVEDVRHQLDRLRKVDRERRAERPGSPAYEAAAQEAERLSRTLMGRMREGDLLGPSRDVRPANDARDRGDTES